MLALGALLLPPAPADAQIYAWRDANGTLVLSDRELDTPTKIYEVPGAPAYRTTTAHAAPRVGATLRRHRRGPRPPPRAAARAGARRHPGGVGLQPAGHVAEGRDGADAADAGHGARARCPEPVRPRGQHSRGHGLPAAAARPATTATKSWRSPPTTPARVPWTATGTCRPTARRATTCARSASRPATAAARQSPHLQDDRDHRRPGRPALLDPASRRRYLRNRPPLNAGVRPGRISGFVMTLIRRWPRLVALSACLLAALGVSGPRPPHSGERRSRRRPPSRRWQRPSARSRSGRLEVGWKQAFLEYFSDSAIGYDGEQVGLAKEQIRGNPDPPKDHQLLWEPRYGDIARSGELGFLTGPSRTILPSRNNGQPRHGVYASVWKRERDGTFKVVMDVGTTTPRAASFAEGFTRAPSANRFTGDLDDRTPPLGTADSVLNSDLKTERGAGLPWPPRAGRPVPPPADHAGRGRVGRPALSGHAAALRAGRFPLRRERAVGRSRLHLGHLEPSPAGGQGRPRRSPRHRGPAGPCLRARADAIRDRRSTCGSGCASAPASGRWCSTC